MDARLMKYIVTLCVLALLTGCAETPKASTMVCKPIYPSRKDVLTRGTKQQILTHNETIEKSVK